MEDTDAGHRCRTQMQDTDAGHRLTFCLMPTVYIFNKTLTVIWAIQSKLPASLNKSKLSSFSSWAVL